MRVFNLNLNSELQKNNHILLRRNKTFREFNCDVAGLVTTVYVKL